MRDLLVLLVHFLTTLARLLGPGGTRAVIAETLVIKHQLVILNRSRRRAPNLTAADRIVMGLCTLFMNPSRIRKVAAALKPATLLAFHQALKERNSEIRIVAADPMGAAMFSYVKTGELKSEGSSITEGIGQGRVTGNIAEAPVDDAYQIPDAEALPVIFDLLKHEGLCLGGSSGINVAGAIRLARDMGPGHTIVTILADFGSRYQSKLFNPEFLRSKNLPVPGWLE